MGRLQNFSIVSTAMAMGLVTAVAASMLRSDYAAADVNVPKGGWRQLENNPGCSIWMNFKIPNLTATWTGDCVDGHAHGRGKQQWRFLYGDNWTTTTYTGEMRSGRNHGRGVYVDSQGVRFDGDWREGQFAHGVVTYEDGVRYKGEMKNFRMHGRGVLNFPNGDKCGGDFREHRLLGTGRGWHNGEKRKMKCYADQGGFKFVD